MKRWMPIPVLMFAGLFLQTACIHDDAKYFPNPYVFPPTFYVSQNLTVRVKHDEKRLKAQLERRGDLITAVFTDPQSTQVLARLDMKKGEAPTFSYQAPILDRSDFAAAKIARAIQYLYEQKEVPLRAGEYLVKGPSNRFQFTWSSMKGRELCQFPDDIIMRFSDEKYEVRIETTELDCSVPL